MRIRLGWFADAPDKDSYSAREARVVLGALARTPNIVPIWFAIGASDPPQIKNGIRIVPVSRPASESNEYLNTLLLQHRPDALVSTCHFHSDCRVNLLKEYRTLLLHKTEAESGHSATAAEQVLNPTSCFAAGNRLPAIAFLQSGCASDDGIDSSALIQILQEHACKCRTDTHNCAPFTLLMRQQLFCNVSISQVMFELTNALLEIGVDCIPQDEQAILGRPNVEREASLYKTGAPEKYSRIIGQIGKPYDPESAVTLHFVLLRSDTNATRCGVSPALTGRELLYTTGNHTVDPEAIPALLDAFQLILAPSRHVIQPYLDAGLSPRFAAVLPHGIDPTVYSPDAQPLRYVTNKGFKFLQTSFPYVYEKGFDLTIKAYCRAFSSRDDVSLLFRVPRLNNQSARASSVERLQALINDAVCKPSAPEIQLIEDDVPLNQRGGVYTGADCYVHPLRAEGFGMTILEAMACALPVIATPWSGPADFLSPQWAYTLRHSCPIPELGPDRKVRRYHVDPDVDHLTHLMRHAFDNREESKTLGLRASSVARTDWTWQKAASTLQSVVRSPFQETNYLLGNGHVAANADELSVTRTSC